MCIRDRLSIDVSASEIIGLNPTLNFDLHVVSKKPSANSLLVSMISENGDQGSKEYNFADMAVGEWVNFSIPIDDLVANTSLDVKHVTSLMHLMIEGEANFYLENVSIKCVNSESCIQGPFSLQTAANPKAEPIRYEAEDYIDASCLLYTSPSPRDVEESRMPSSA